MAPSFSPRSPIIVAGPPREAAALARQLAAAPVGPVGILGRTPGEAAAAAAALPDRIRPLRRMEDLAGAGILVITGGADPEGADLEALAAVVSRLAPEAVAVFSGRGSSEAARRFMLRSRIEPRRLLATGGLGGQLLVERRVALALSVSRSQVCAPVAGGESGRVIPLRARLRVAGIPVGLLDGDGPGGATNPVDPAAWGDGIERRAAGLLVVSVRQDRRRVLSAGSWLEEGLGLPPGFYTLPVVVGREGVASRLPLGLTLEERSFLLRDRVLH
jgi:hypothetical protein